MSRSPNLASGLSRNFLVALATLLTSTPALRAASPVSLSFEGFAGPGGLVNVSPATPYSEAGYTLTAANGSSAVFDATASSDMPGNETDWFGFAESNTITLQHVAGRPFDLISLLIGRSTLASLSTISFTITGTTADGNNLSGTRTGLTTATLAPINWKNLTQLVLRANDDAGVDDITVALVPEPATGLLAIIGVVTLYRRRGRGSKAST
jgi:hypothetical protein